ncbi:MAG: hypothetical protein CMI73_04290 [Candidatus Pelagibacter sp.]|nr:hypothetical protein [Candidatus Pelagibacter sp.]OUV86692.1 MAG: twin transmembrane helix small protein [Pelagibacteraceae bacterium TMED136]|tara:strand:- start:622 stop:825 length:204 start_codon:yes stop_codon:yes gene_type:complete
MTENIIKFFAILAMVAVVIVLIRGLKTFFIGGNLETKKKSNKLMQMRIMLQFCAIIILMFLAYIMGK